MENSMVIVVLALILMGGFLMTRVTKLLHLPNVTAYIAVGVILGPSLLSTVPRAFIEGTGFISDIALALIAFGVGEFFKLPTIRRCGGATAAITVIEAVTVSGATFCILYFLLGLNFQITVVLSALAAATAPTSTMMTIRQTSAKGNFVDTLLQVMAFDNVISLIMYSTAISLALATISGSFSGATIFIPLLKNGGAILLGGLFGLILKLFLKEGRSGDNRLIITVALLLFFCGICAVLDISPLLGCMAIGAVYINLTGDNRLFLQIGYFSPPILLVFFVRSGLNFDFTALFSGGEYGGVSLFLISVVYFGVRLAAKYLGAFIGGVITRRERTVRNYLGLALIPQAGVSIGLAALGSRAIGGELGAALETVILSAGIMYEFIGPTLARLALSLSHSIGGDEVAAAAPPDASELIERVKQIRSERRSALPPIGEEERAFTEAAENQSDSVRTVLYSKRRR